MSMDCKVFKRQVQEVVKQKIDDKISICESRMKSLFESKTADTKSSAGDKFETGRAMIQIEESQVQKQYKEAKDMDAKHMQHLKNVNRDKVGLNCLVKAGDMIFYLSVSLGKLTIENEIVFCISDEAPIARHVLGKKVDDTFQLNGKDMRIIDIC